MGAFLGGFFGRGGRNLRDVDRRDPSPASAMTGVVRTQPSASGRNTEAHRRMISMKYSYIPDNYNTLDQVTAALREAGLESSNLILGIDFTKSNDWTGKYSFNNRSLHAIGDKPNPYEEAISIIGKTLAPFDEDNLIPCFGFGDATTHDRQVFSFHGDHSPCHGFEEVLECYRKIVPYLKLSAELNLATIADRMAVKRAVQSGNVQDAIEKVIHLNPEILNTNPHLYFHLQQQKLIELIRYGKVEEALEFAQEELAPRGEENQNFLEELERTVALLAFEDVKNCPFGELLDLSQRLKTASEVNAAILTSQSHEKDPKLPRLLKMLIWIQNQLDEKAAYPRINDLTTAALEEPAI